MLRILLVWSDHKKIFLTLFFINFTFLRIWTNNTIREKTIWFSFSSSSFLLQILFIHSFFLFLQDFFYFFNNYHYNIETFFFPHRDFLLQTENQRFLTLCFCYCFRRVNSNKLFSFFFSHSFLFYSFDFKSALSFKTTKKKQGKYL